MTNLPTQAEKAHAIEQRVKSLIHEIRFKWVELAGELYQFGLMEGWKALGYDSLNEWLADPEVEIERRTYFQLTENFREFVVLRKIEARALGVAEYTKLAVVLPAMRRGQVDANEALADALTLSRSDLRDRYRLMPPTGEEPEPEPVDSFHYENCPSCGSKIRVRDG